MIGQTFRHYHISSLLGVGGMGEVYRARDTKLGREVAIKVLPASIDQDPLEALAWNLAYSRHPVCTMFDARKKEVYAAAFRWEGDGFQRVAVEMSAKVDWVLECIKEEWSLPGEKFLFTGEGALLYRDMIISRLGEKALFPPPDKMIPSPANVAYLGLQKALRGEFAEPVSLVPFYIRKSEAEMKKNV